MPTVDADWDTRSGKNVNDGGSPFSTAASTINGAVARDEPLDAQRSQRPPRRRRHTFFANAPLVSVRASHMVGVTRFARQDVAPDTRGPGTTTEANMQDVIFKLRNERDALRARLTRIEAAIEEYDRWARDAAGLVSSSSQTAVTASLPPVKQAQESGAADPTPVAVFEQKTREILEDAPAPLKRTEVYNALAEVGVVLGGKNPLNTVASRLSRMKGVVNLKGQGYWLEERPYAPAGHSGASPEGGALFDGAVEDANPDGSSDNDGERA